SRSPSPFSFQSRHRRCHLAGRRRPTTPFPSSDEHLRFCDPHEPAHLKLANPLLYTFQQRSSDVSPISANFEYGLEKYVVGLMYSSESREKEHPVYL
uniref:Uncharacterized protein n=1 Tax=Cucumis melo TaxID=3656 RepID=A0A9I9EHX7_CUCME